ncbi:MAG: glutathione S-transferase family protein [Gammaproteobacteria bacterium]|nr:glutathione S-transferase family protein [Gammaproteobacteria bacterium]
MKLYYHPMSTYSQKVLIAFHEKDIEFKPAIVQLMNPEAREQYRKIYPMGKVPMLMVEGDHMIPESSTIIEYLDGLAGSTLIPAEPERARKTRFKERMFDFYLADSLAALFFEGLKPEDAQDLECIDTAEIPHRRDVPVHG